MLWWAKAPRIFRGWRLTYQENSSISRPREPSFQATAALEGCRQGSPPRPYLREETPPPCPRCLCRSGPGSHGWEAAPQPSQRKCPLCPGAGGSRGDGEAPGMQGSHGTKGFCAPCSDPPQLPVVSHGLQARGGPQVPQPVPCPLVQARRQPATSPAPLHPGALAWTPAGPAVRPGADRSSRAADPIGSVKNPVRKRAQVRVRLRDEPASPPGPQRLPLHSQLTALSFFLLQLPSAPGPRTFQNARHSRAPGLTFDSLVACLLLGHTDSSLRAMLALRPPLHTRPCTPHLPCCRLST